MRMKGRRKALGVLNEKLDTPAGRNRLPEAIRVAKARLGHCYLLAGKALREQRTFPWP